MDLDDDVLSVLRALARQERRGLGAVTSDLVRRALAQPPTGAVSAGPGDAADLPVFPVPVGARLFGPDEVARALAEP